MVNSCGMTCRIRCSSPILIDFAVWIARSISSWETSSSEIVPIPFSIRLAMCRPEIERNTWLILHSAIISA
ncbi:Uncharacterised protein [Vibrio cholerae]|nr:Uncharacterised protein [Vibrio cholerae]